MVAAAEALYLELNAAGYDCGLDDRGVRPGAMFADIELIGIPQRVVAVSYTHLDVYKRQKLAIKPAAAGLARPMNQRLSTVPT